MLFSVSEELKHKHVEEVISEDEEEQEWEENYLLEYDIEEESDDVKADLAPKDYTFQVTGPHGARKITKIFFKDQPPISNQTLTENVEKEQDVEIGKDN